MCPIISGSGGGGSGALTRIDDQTLAIDGIFTFSGIPGTFNHLLIVAQIRLTNATTFDNLVLRFNNDGNARYASQNVSGSQSSASAAEVATTASPSIARVAAGSATAGFASALEIFIPNYAGTTFAKEAVCSTFGSSALTTGTILRVDAGVSYNQTVAITRVDLFGATTANALAGSRASLYGVT